MYYIKKKDIWIFSKEDKEAAHNISTSDYLNINYGFTFKKEGSQKRCREHSSLVIKPDDRAWYWNSQSCGGGDIIEFLKKIEHKTYEEALIALLSPTESDSKKTSYAEAPEKVDIPEERELILPPKKQGRYSRVFAYLTQTRCLDKNIINILLKKKFIYEDSNGNCVFIGYNKLGLPSYAAIRTTNTMSRYRRDAIGSDKKNGFYIKGFNKRKIYVFEAPIDLLSHATLQNINTENEREWLNSTRLSLGGVSDIALERFLEDYPEIEEICFCLDNDAAGHTATEKYLIKYADKGYKVSAEPPAAKDYNEELKAVVTEKTQAFAESFDKAQSNRKLVHHAKW